MYRGPRAGGRNQGDAKLPYIETIDPDSATGELAEVYAAIGQARGGVAAVHQVQSLNPRVIRAHLEMYKTVMFARSPLTRIQRERIGVVVSAANECEYCIEHHAEALKQLGDEETVFRAIARGELPDSLPAPDRALLGWARRATERPAGCGADDVEALRRHGFDDRAILDASLVVGYFCFVNRLVLLLGADLEEGFEEYCGDGEAP